jgi:hypothetical protein
VKKGAREGGRAGKQGGLLLVMRREDISSVGVGGGLGGGESGSRPEAFNMYCNLQRPDYFNARWEMR